MWFSHPFQRHVCAFIVLVGCVTTYISYKNKNQNSAFVATNETIANDTTDVSTFSFKETKTSKNHKNYFNIPNFRDEKINDRDVYILGLFELSTKWGSREEGISELAAARLAINHVNAFKILPGYALKLITNDTKCDPGVGVDSFFHAIYSNKLILMLLGSGCSNVTESLANIMPYWNILQVSYGSTSPLLSDRSKFPLFFRTVAPDSSHNSARISFIKHFGWNMVATLSLSRQPYLLSLNNFVHKLETANVYCVATITFSLENYKEQLKTLKELDTRIIIGSFSANIAPKIFCEVYNLKMYGMDYVWILQDQTALWWKNPKECQDEFLRQSVEGLILVSDYNYLSNNETAISGIHSNKVFEEQLNISKMSISKYAPQTYDAIWAMALTLRQTILCKHDGYLKEFNYKDSTMLKQFVDAIESLKFVGISVSTFRGPVKFDGADRIGNSIFKQIQDGNLSAVAIYYAESNFLDFHCQDCIGIKWHGDEIPIAQRIFKFRLVTIPKLAFIIVFGFATIGIMLSLIFLYFNLHFRKMYAVKLSSPRLNNFVVLGCILVYVAVIFLGFDQGSEFLDINWSHLCTVRVYLFSAGFSLTFGSIFAKTYRVHRIFTYSATSLVKDKLLKDKQLIALICVLLLIDGFITLLWIMIDPLKKSLRDLPEEMSLEDRGIVYQPQVEVCRSENTTGWFIAIYSYKGFLLIMGVYMAWETRHVKIPSLNDSQYIGICVYSVVSSSIIVVISNFLADYITLSYLATSLSIIASTTLTLVLLFVPKFRAVFGRIDDENAIVQSMGLKIESNTRRFMLEDHRELLYRMEVQNKVYKNEIKTLDKEIARLEEILKSSTSTTSKSDSVTSDSYTITKGIFLLPIPNPSRASWPSTNRTIIQEQFLSENKLDKTSNEVITQKFKIFDRLKSFFGSIPSVWMFSLVQDKQLCENSIVEKETKTKLNSTPEFYTLSVNDNIEIGRSTSATCALNSSEFKRY
ncbi:hypothetical protein RN001_003804 [Aquatica leii]|uniref:Gamma-aminobutyric acid type B receptor subunit 2 n=1 Tax=Aquatica leii TaxID=1421715 RepID=A0AAN7SRQ4_9COLE|nr:hypothetical protein RN001_003804 [Aquatica leii]